MKIFFASQKNLDNKTENLANGNFANNNPFVELNFFWFFGSFYKIIVLLRKFDTFCWSKWH